mmetsp:Transcript_35469/g.52098  ORF Transcript_35469/g.52098 Transcript_35469/m.52098 type:complete len:84 (+) Transcript_35469:379-630(+)
MDLFFKVAAPERTAGGKIGVFKGHLTSCQKDQKKVSSIVKSLPQNLAGVQSMGVISPRTTRGRHLTGNVSRHLPLQMDDDGDV